MECPVCSRSFLSERGLVQHTEQVHGRSGVYKGVRSWESSRQQTGAITTGVQDTEYAYDIQQSQYCGRREAWICNICDSRYPKKLQLEQHLRSGIHEEHRYACEGCAKSFPSLGSLSQHLAATGHSNKEARLIHVMVNDAQQTRLMITNGTAPRTFFEATLYFDGSAQPNPGAGGCGAYLVDDLGKVLYKAGKAVSCLPGEYNVTNNQAEYAGLVVGLRQAVTEGIKRLRVRGDSELVIRHMKGEYQCVSDRLVPWYNIAKRLERDFQVIEYEHIPRSENTIADSLSNEYRAWT